MAGGFYIERASILHRLHPVTKIFLLLMSFAAALLLEHPLWLIGLWAVFMAAGARTGVFKGLRRVLWILVLIGAASFAIWTFAYGGQTVVFRLGPLAATREGMMFGAGMGLRLDLMVFCGLIFLTTTMIEEFTEGLTRLGLPFPAAFALSLSFRLIPLFADTARTIIDAQRSRGLSPASGGPLKKARNYIPLLAPVFSSALRRTDNLAIALESRGFGRTGRRGRHREHRAGLADAAALVFMGALLALEVWLRWKGLGVV